MHARLIFTYVPADWLRAPPEDVRTHWCVGKFEVTFKKTKETRAGIRASDYVVVVDDWFWVSR